MEFKVFDLGLLDFESARQCQKEIFREVKGGHYLSALILCRHYPVITLGRSAKKENIRVSESELFKKGIRVYEIERGGDVAYHGPGQLTVYPVFNLEFFKKDIHLFLRKLEELAIDFLADFGVGALRYPGLTGVWVGNKKIASIGIAIRNWITFHGISINVKRNDLANFSLIRPCGMEIEMTSLETLLDRDIEIETIKENLINKFRDTLRDSARGGSAFGGNREGVSIIQEERDDAGDFARIG
jgi:lipoate-protein ligase B